MQLQDQPGVGGSALRRRNHGFQQSYPGARPVRFGRCRFTHRARVEYLRPVRRANWGSDSPLRARAARISRRCALVTRSRPWVSAMTGSFANPAAGDASA